MNISEITTEVIKDYKDSIYRLIIKGVKEKQKYLITIIEYDKCKVILKYLYSDKPYPLPRAIIYDLSSITEDDIKEKDDEKT